MPILDNHLRVAVYDEGTAYVVAAFASWIWELGHARLVVQGDGELAILALVAAFRDKVIADGRAEQIVCPISPRGSHESNGAADRTVQQVRGMARVYLEHERENLDLCFLRTHPCRRALRHGAWTYNRLLVRANTRTTPYSQIRLKTYAQPLLSFGELALARRPGAHLQNSQTQFVCGCWLGGTRSLTNSCWWKTLCVSCANVSKVDRGQVLVVG